MGLSLVYFVFCLYKINFVSFYVNITCTLLCISLLLSHTSMGVQRLWRTIFLAFWNLRFYKQFILHIAFHFIFFSYLFAIQYLFLVNQFFIRYQNLLNFYSNQVIFLKQGGPHFASLRYLNLIFLYFRYDYFISVIPLFVFPLVPYLFNFSNI